MSKFLLVHGSGHGAWCFEKLLKELKNIGDIERLYRKLILQRVAPAELSQFYNGLKVILFASETL